MRGADSTTPSGLRSTRPSRRRLARPRRGSSPSSAGCSAADPTQQRATPLELVRGAVREPTAVLRAAGVPPVVRDDFEERAWPDDRYGLTPRAAGDLGDPELGPMLLAWGLAKSAVVRARRG